MPYFCANRRILHNAGNLLEQSLLGKQSAFPKLNHHEAKQAGFYKTEYWVQESADSVINAAVQNLMLV